jgi:hypothetical protein
MAMTGQQTADQERHSSACSIITAKTKSDLTLNLYIKSLRAVVCAISCPSVRVGHFANFAADK